MEKGSIQLREGELFLTQEPNELFCVIRGTVELYMVPMEGDHHGRAIELCEAKEKTVFPAIAFQDHEGVLWCMQIKALGADATLTKSIDGPSMLEKSKKRLMQQIGISEKEQHFERCYDLALRNFYMQRKWSEDNKLDPPQPPVRTPETYTVLAYLCRASNISFPEWETLLPQVGREPSVPELAEAGNLICRKIVLEDRCWKLDCGMLITMLEDELVALVHGSGGRYRIYRPTIGRSQRMTRNIAKRLAKDAYVIQRTLPARSIEEKELRRFVWSSVDKRDLLLAGILSLASILVGFLLPVLNQYVYDDFIPMGDYSMLQSMCMLIGTFMIGNITFSLVRSLLEFRIARQAGYTLQDAAFQRVFQLPQHFFIGMIMAIWLSDSVPLIHLPLKWYLKSSQAAFLVLSHCFISDR